MLPLIGGQSVTPLFHARRGHQMAAERLSPEINGTKMSTNKGHGDKLYLSLLGVIAESVLKRTLSSFEER
jgi:hypothetical protein